MRANSNKTELEQRKQQPEQGKQQPEQGEPPEKGNTEEQSSPQVTAIQRNCISKTNIPRDIIIPLEIDPDALDLNEIEMDTNQLITRLGNIVPGTGTQSVFNVQDELSFPVDLEAESEQLLNMNSVPDLPLNEINKTSAEIIASMEAWTSLPGEEELRPVMTKVIQVYRNLAPLPRTFPRKEILKECLTLMGQDDDPIFLIYAIKTFLEHLSQLMVNWANVKESEKKYEMNDWEMRTISVFSPEFPNRLKEWQEAREFQAYEDQLLDKRYAIIEAGITYHLELSKADYDVSLVKRRLEAVLLRYAALPTDIRTEWEQLLRLQYMETRLFTGVQVKRPLVEAFNEVKSKISEALTSVEEIGKQLGIELYQKDHRSRIDQIAAKNFAELNRDKAIPVYQTRVYLKLRIDTHVIPGKLLDWEPIGSINMTPGQSVQKIIKTIETRIQEREKTQSVLNKDSTSAQERLNRAIEERNAANQEQEQNHAQYVHNTDAQQTSKELQEAESDRIRTNQMSSDMAATQDTEDFNYHAGVEANYGGLGQGVSASAGVDGGTTSATQTEQRTEDQKEQERSKDVNRNSMVANQVSTDTGSEQAVRDTVATSTETIQSGLEDHVTESNKAREQLVAEISAETVERTEEHTNVVTMVNPAKYHSLNVVIYSQIQEYITASVLTNISIILARPDYYKEIPIAQLPAFLETYLADNERGQKELRNILRLICLIGNYEDHVGTLCPLLEVKAGTKDLVTIDAKALDAELATIQDLRNLRFARKLRSYRQYVGNEANIIPEIAHLPGVVIRVHRIYDKTHAIGYQQSITENSAQDLRFDELMQEKVCQRHLENEKVKIFNGKFKDADLGEIGDFLLKQRGATDVAVNMMLHYMKRD